MAQLAAKAGLVKSQFALATALFDGVGTPADQMAAIEFFNRAAAQDHVQSNWRLAQIYAAGSEVIPADIGVAVKFLKTAANLGHPMAANDYGLWLIKKEDKILRLDEARKYFAIAANNSITEAQYQLATILLNPKFEKPDFEQALELYEAAAKAGDERSQMFLGHYYSQLDKGRDQRELAHDYFALAAAQGNAEAQFNLGNILLFGLGVPIDSDNGFLNMKIAAEQGYVDAQHNLAGLYFVGKGVDQSPEAALLWYEKAASQDFSASYFPLGTIYRQGLGTTPDLAKTVKFYGAAAAAGDVDAQFEIGMMYWLGNEILPDETKAHDYLKQAADAGLSIAQYQYANFLENKNSDPTTINYYYLLAANQGHAMAQAIAGARVFDGIGMAADALRAGPYLQAAADAGILDAQIRFGKMLKKGNGVEKNAAMAFTYYKKAAEQGHADAQFIVAEALENGDGVSVDFTEAARWYELAADAGIVPAMLNLGVMLENGRGIKANLPAALLRYKAAAEAGNVQSQINLGVLYVRGVEQLQDFEQAHMWFNIAASTGHVLAQKYRDTLASRMGKAALAGAQKKARSCVAKALKDC